MKQILIHFKKIDWLLSISAVLLSLIGLFSILSSSLGRGGNLLNFKKQALFLIIGFLLMLGFSFFDYRNLKNNSFFILSFYLLCVFALVGLLFFNHPIRGARSWYKVGAFAFSPTEFMKLALIILLAKYFSYRHIEMYRFVHIFLSGLYVALPALLMNLQPDLGSALVIIFLWIGILIVSGIKLGHFIILSLVAVIIFVFSWSFLLRGYQKERIISFVTPEYQPLEIGWNQKQAKIAIGNGGLLGQGFRKGSQTQNGFLPEPQADFVFSAMAEEFGFWSIGLLLSLFLLFFWRLTKIALLAKNNFSRFFVLGFGIVIIAQMLINIGSNIGFLPVIGIPLPFVSYGGSSLIAMFLGLAIVQNIRISSKI